ncbi:hypothetical protein EXIGLDRAFT_721298 [Exidia glandulosa HHB12029]|uniref:DUF6533 domain-containing protein n=1 Tax=Exidia glandulosa HHB12029 TaxID=1314781 RepID=A0A165NC24_EXIGL|nr:hypothetical protein EXIGLDRAFT_721298 [Exidia glandulosa HHB12029]
MDGAPQVALEASTAALHVDPRAANSIMLASFILLIHEWFVTLEEEIQRIWMKPWTLFTAYWVAVRYLPFAARVLGVIGLFKLSWSTQVRAATLCQRFVPAAPIILGWAISTGHLALLMRIHVLWERRWLVSALPAFLWTLEFAANVYPVFDRLTIGESDPGLPSCIPTIIGRKAAFRLTSAMCDAVAFDISVTVLLVVKSVSLDRQRSERHPLVRLLLIHGTPTFGKRFTSNRPLAGIGVVLLLNSLNLVFIHATFTIFMLIIPNIVINRLILSLRAYESSCQADMRVAATQPSVHTNRSLTLTSPFGVNTILEAFQQPLHFPAPHAATDHPLSDIPTRPATHAHV